MQKNHIILTILYNMVHIFKRYIGIQIYLSNVSKLVFHNYEVSRVNFDQKYQFKIKLTYVLNDNNPPKSVKVTSGSILMIYIIYVTRSHFNRFCKVIAIKAYGNHISNRHFWSKFSHQMF